MFGITTIAHVFPPEEAVGIDMPETWHPILQEPYVQRPLQRLVAAARVINSSGRW